MKIKFALLILLAVIITSCGDSNDDGARVLSETWELQSIEVNDFYDFNGDNDYTGNLTAKLGCTGFDNYFLYSNGTGEEHITKSVAIYFDSQTSSVAGVCSDLSAPQIIDMNWSQDNNQRTFTYQNFSATGTVVGNTLTFVDIDFPLYTDASLTAIEILIPATFTYQLVE